MNICFETFGCRLSRAEALEHEARMLALGHHIVHSHAEADMFVVRGCSVTARAQSECEHLIRHISHKYPNKRIVITGCLPGAEKEIVTEKSTPIPTRTARAYLKVQDGCSGQCTFCIVPKFRGASRSVAFDETLDKAKRFIDAGYHEIVVTGCNLALYASNGKRLPELLAALAKLDEHCRIRLGSLEPWGCASEVVDVMAEQANVCPFLHIPVQSGSERILQLMKRPYTVADVEALVKKARAQIPDIALGCDLMTGFPSEQEGDFGYTRRLLAHLDFTNAHIFPYSERPGTPAAAFVDVIGKDVRSRRAHELTIVARANRARFAKSFVGKTVNVVIESHGEQPKGWTSHYLWFEGPLHATYAQQRVCRRKACVPFIVKSADGDVLRGVPTIHGR